MKPPQAVVNKYQRRVNFMTTQDFITESFCKVDDQMANVPQRSQALLGPIQAVTIGLLQTIKGKG